MDFMGESGMPPDMMGDFQDIAQGCFDQYMGDNPDAAPMDAFDAVGAGIDHHMADMPDMNCADMAADMPPMPTDFGGFMGECPPCGGFPGGDNYDPAAHPHEGGMADMMWDHHQVIWLDHHQVKVGHHQAIWRVTQWDHHQVIWRWDHHQVIMAGPTTTGEGGPPPGEAGPGPDGPALDLMENQWDLQWDHHPKPRRWFWTRTRWTSSRRRRCRSFIW